VRSGKEQVLAHCNDLQTAAAVFAANPALADNADALGSAARHEGFLRLMLRYQPDLPQAPVAATPAAAQAAPHQLRDRFVRSGRT
jgi:hypothetical protein